MVDPPKNAETSTLPSVAALSFSTLWGPALWTFLYVTAATDFNLVSLEQFLVTVQSLSSSLPCAKCQRHLQDYMETHGNALALVATPFQRVIWVSHLENDVRKLLGEQPLTLEALLRHHKLPTPNPAPSLKPLVSGPMPPTFPNQEMIAMKAAPQRRCCQRSLASGSSFLGIRRSVRELRITG
jgi:hypothetical protein